MGNMGGTTIEFGAEESTGPPSNLLNIGNYQGFTKTGWTLSETADDIKATLDSDLTVNYSASEVEVEFLKVIIYKSVDGSGDTELFTLPAGGVSADITAYIPNPDIRVDIDSSTIDDGQFCGMRFYADNIDTQINLDTDVFADFPAHGAGGSVESKMLVVADYGDNISNFLMINSDSTESVEIDEVDNASTGGNSYGIMITAVLFADFQGSNGADFATVKSGTFANFRKEDYSTLISFKYGFQ